MNIEQSSTGEGVSNKLEDGHVSSAQNGQRGLKMFSNNSIMTNRSHLMTGVVYYNIT